MIIESPLIYHDLILNTIKGEKATLKVYKKDSQSLVPDKTYKLEGFTMKVEKERNQVKEADISSKMMELIE